MADPAFLKYLSEVHELYVPVPTPLNKEYGERLEERLRHISERLNDPWGYKGCVGDMLIDLSCFALQGLGATKETFEEIISLHTRKNKGYAGVQATDPWANFRMATMFRVTPFTGCLVRMTDKLIRIKHLIESAEADQVNESIKDTLSDLAIYALIARCLWAEELEAGKVHNIAHPV